MSKEIVDCNYNRSQLLLVKSEESKANEAKENYDD